MKKKILFCIIISMFILSGCQVSSDNYLTFQDIDASTDNNTDRDLTESDFFATNLVVIPEIENQGEDAALTAGATLLVNVKEKEALYADNVYEKLYPASLTKLLTALVVFRYGELSDSVSVSYKASHIPEIGAKICGFEEGDVLSLETLLNCLLIYSGNDAGIAIAEHISGSEEAFAKKMNEEARRIGAVHSNFVNSHGLHDDSQYTTAYDMYLIFNELIQSDLFRSIINSASYTANYTDKDGAPKEKTFETTDQYLEGTTPPPEGVSVIGGKTGTTNLAGNCLILLCKDSNQTDYIALILKAEGNDQLYTQMTHLISSIKD